VLAIHLIPFLTVLEVFLNLFLNATQAIDTQGDISFSTENREGYIYVIIEDSGYGIDGEHLKDIFNPFFTTKSSTEANGLGLSIAYNILRKAGGDIHIQSTVQKGTTVEVILPVIEKGEKVSYEHPDHR